MNIKIENLIGVKLNRAVAYCTGYEWKPEIRPERCFDCQHYEERQGRDDAIQYCHHPEMDFNDGSGGDNWYSDGEVHKQCPYKNEVQITKYPDYSTDWAIGGPLIKKIEFKVNNGGISANFVDGLAWWGEDYLIAAMRCIVAKKFGDEIDFEII